MLNMENAIVILNAGDITAAEHIAKDLPAYTVYIFDPMLFDLVAASGLENIRFIPWDNCPLYHQLDAEARAAAFALEAELDLAVRTIAPEVSIASWQHLNLYYLMMSLKWYTALWDELGSVFAGAKVHIFICDNPAAYYFNSFIPSFLLLWYLKSHDIEFSGYSYGEKPDNTGLIPDLSGENGDQHLEQLLTHLPTCMYDFGYFDQEIRASGKMPINIEARYFSTPIQAHKTLGLVSAEETITTLPEATRQKINAFSEQLAEALDRLLKPYIVIPLYRTRQTQYIGNLYRSQLVTYYQLNRHFTHSKPSKILLSDHDAGFHGPIISFAQQNFLPVLLLPHAKTSADIEFKYDNIIALSHPVQGRDIFDANGRHVINEAIIYPETFNSSSLAGEGIRTVSLLLNAQSLNGIFYTRWADYLDGIRQIVAWCKDNDITLKIRCKPSYSIMSLLATEVGLDIAVLQQNLAESMEQHVENCDLCLMYDTPTSAALYFLKRSVPILNPVVKALSPAELTMINTNVVPQESVEAILRKLKGFKSNPMNFSTFRNAQFSDYIQLFRHARPLRSHL
ncbi:MAG: hypothetical protein ACXWE9_07770 [Methylobacter sp.]